MKRTILATAVTLALLGPAMANAETADAAELEVLRQQVQALMQRIEQLEQTVAAKPALAATPVTAAPVQVAAVETAAPKAMEWAGRIKWKGDLRYRHEQLDIEGASADRVRHRIRARFGLEAKVNDRMTAVLRLATGDLSDPRSTNATLDDANRRKDVALDLAYVSWRAFDGGEVFVGKQPQPWFTGGNSMFFDSDVNPEGVSLRYDNGAGLFASTWGFWLEESASQADANLFGAQLGYGIERLGLTLAAGYWDYGAIQGQPLLNFSGAPAGNSVTLASASCLGVGTTPCYTHDYDIVVMDAQWNGKAGALPVMVFGGYLKNLDPDQLESGYNLGFMLGKASAAGSWEFGALYQDVEQDAQLGAFADSDFADGMTQGRGFQLQGAFAPVQNMTLKATLYLNDRSYDTPAETDVKRLQLDLNYKF